MGEISTVEALERIASEHDGLLYPNPPQHCTDLVRIAREALPRARAEAEEREEPINALCEQTWRRDVQGACPVHGGDSCLVNPSAQAEELERVKSERVEIRDEWGQISHANYQMRAQLTKQAEELERLRAADAEWKADTLQEQAARIKAQAAVIEAAKRWAESLGGNYDKPGHPADINALCDALDSLTTTQGDQEP